ncbi:MAG: hydroxyphenylacetyl-CoA thioesterase PaaI [Nakamurella sp.]
MAANSGAIGTAGTTGATAMMSADLASAGAGLEVLELGQGTATVTMTVREDMANGHGITHGGYVFLLADTAFACACNSEGAVTVATGADINFLAATRPGDVLTARAESRILSGRSGLYDVTVTRRSDTGRSDTVDEVVAEFRGRSRTLAPRAPAPRQAGRVRS